MQAPALRFLSRTLPLLLLLLSPGLAASRAAALEIGFDELLSLGDVAAASLPGVSVSSALVLSESDAGALTGLPALGTWATSGTNGLLNTLAAEISFTFDAPIAAFAVDVLSLVKDGVALAIELRGFDGTAQTASAISDVSLLGDSGLPEQRLSLAGSFTRIEIRALAPCATGLCASSETSTFWLDTASTVPEPGTAMLFGLGLALLGHASQRGARS